MEVKIKTEFLKKVIGFNNSALPLGERNDLDVLYELAVSSRNPNLLNLFEDRPDADKADKLKEERVLANTDAKKAKNISKNRAHTPDQP